MKWNVLVFIVIVVFSIFSFYKTAAEVYEKSRRLTDLKSEISTLEAENSRLKKDVEYKSTDDYIRKEAKDKLFLGMPNEIVLIIPKDLLSNLRKEMLKSNVLGSKTEKPIWMQWKEVLIARP